jgi:hypothetical protein
MNNEKAKELAIVASEQYPTAKILYVCTDENVFAEPALATAHAVTLSTGNPEVFEVEIEVKGVAAFVTGGTVKEVVTDVLVEALSGAVAAPAGDLEALKALVIPAGDAESFGNAGAEAGKEVVNTVVVDKPALGELAKEVAKAAEEPAKGDAAPVVKLGDKKGK